jgi:hypothetical protein
MASINNLIQAVVDVMDECKGVGKNLKVGKGNNAYQGVGAKDVFLQVSESMVKHGLCVFPIDIEEDTQFQEYVDSYGNKKSRFFTKVKVKYELTHTSGESKVCFAIGHGADSLDKACGKAMTYALKTFCIYQFFIATGHIEDADNNHSNELSNDTQKPNGFKDKRINPFAYGDDLVKQVANVIAGIHKNIDLQGDAPDLDTLKNCSIEDLGQEFTIYTRKESQYNYVQFIKRKLNDPTEVWNIERLKKLKEKCVKDNAFDSEVEALLGAKVLEVSQ